MYHYFTSHLGGKAKELRNATIRLVSYARVSVRVQQGDSHREHLHEILYLESLEKFVSTSQFRLQSG
jgi:hypothetical protein